MTINDLGKKLKLKFLKSDFYEKYIDALIDVAVSVHECDTSLTELLGDNYWKHAYRSELVAKEVMAIRNLVEMLGDRHVHRWYISDEISLSDPNMPDIARCSFPGCSDVFTLPKMSKDPI